MKQQTYSHLLPLSLKAWQQAKKTADFDAILKQELISLDHHELPLQQALRLSSSVSPRSISPVVLSRQSDEHSVQVKVSIFYEGIIAGCSCADDPSPLDTQQEQCDIMITIDNATAKSVFTLLDNDSEF